MTYKYELDFKQCLIKCTGKGIENSCERKKCFQFSVQTVSVVKKQPIKLHAGKCIRKCWLYGPATTLDTKTIIYPCTRNRCSIPCPCYLCLKKHPKCRVPSSQSCQCKECLSFFINHTKYHAALHHGCKQCFQLTQIFPHLNLNLLNTTKERKIPYGLVETSRNINEKLSEQNNFAHHFLNEHKMKCYWCKAIFHSYEEWRKHDLLVSNCDKYRKSQIVSCDDCGKIFSNQFALQRHIKTIHKSSESEVFKCKGCDLMFSRKDHLTRHEQTDHKPYQTPKCKNCSSAFSSKNKLSRHIKDLSNDDGTFKYVCPHCDQQFCTHKLLKAHNMLHHGSFTCNWCGKNFSQKGNLMRHIKTKKEQSCNLCELRFCNKKSLDNHLQVHIQNRC